MSGPLQPLTDPILLAHKAKLEGSQGTAGVTSAPVYTSDVARDIGSSTRPAKDIALPGQWAKFKAKLWCLNDGELLAAKAATHDFFDAFFKGRDIALRLAADQSILVFEEDRQQLALALRRFDDPSRPLFSVEEIRYLFSRDEVNALVVQLAEYTAERSPFYTAKSKEEVLALLKTHAGGAEASFEWLRFCEIDTLRSIVRVLLDPSTRPTNESSSSTSPSSTTTA